MPKIALRHVSMFTYPKIIQIKMFCLEKIINNQFIENKLMNILIHK